MGEPEVLSFGLTIDEEACSTCSLCVYVCPFEAITVKQLNDERKVEVDESKCRFCGLCYGMCPLEAIKIGYYELEDLVKQAEKLCTEAGARSLIIACKGSNPTDAIINGRVGDGKLPVLKVPCVGRVPLDFYVKLLADGVVERLHVLPCEEEFCRLKEGGRISSLRVDYLKDLLGELEADGRLLNVVKGVNKAEVDETKCVGCGNCVHYCPYEAASLKSPGIASIDEEKCMGCGICLAYCPNFAITLEGYEHESLSETVSKLAGKAVAAGEAPIAVFYCQWAYTPKPLKENGSNLCFIELPCAGRADPLHVIQALNLGFKGVLILACKQDLCNFEEAGAKRAEENLGILKKLLEQLGLGERVEIAFVSPKYPGEADQALSSFIGKLKG
ncbi:MAG: 4Fe-4S binding protein [Candidatus Hecatellaceae archaeon]